jgi:hypothetical protein
VLVGTPSIDLARKLVSSTYTPGVRYSGTLGLLMSYGMNGYGTPGAYSDPIGMRS